MTACTYIVHMTPYDLDWGCSWRLEGILSSTEHFLSPTDTPFVDVAESGDEVAQ